MSAVREAAAPAVAVGPTLRTRAFAFVANEATRSAALSFGLKLGGSALNLLMLTLVARSMSGHEFGVFAFWFNVLALLTVTAGLGQEKLILRSWSEYAAKRAWSLARGALVFGLRITLLGAAIVGAGIVAAGWAADTEPALLWAAAAFLVVQSLFIFSAHVNRAMVGILGGDLHELTWRAVVTVVFGAALAWQVPLAASDFFVAASAGFAIGLAFQTVSAWRHVPAEVRSARSRTKARLWSRRSFGMALGGNLEAGSQYLEVILVGLVLSPLAAGEYFIASRLANLFSMITSGLYTYSARQIPQAHYRGGRAAVSAALRRISLLTLVPTAIGLVLILLAGRPVLSLFGPGFVGDYPVLICLSVGTAIVALAGPAPTLLLLTGHERTYSVLLALTLALRLGALALLAHMFGPLGAAVASTGANVVGAVALNAACRLRAGVDPSCAALLLGGRRPA